jgi:DNA-binding winged helix-turn-helix (wHTH) protein
MAIRFGSFELDRERRQLSREGLVQHLTPKAFDLLLLLAEAAPRVVPKSELHQALWPSGVVTDATLAGLVKEIRRAVSDTDGQSSIIRTAHRVGYAFEAPVITVPDPPVASADRHWLTALNRRFALAEGENIIGRDPAAHVWLDYATISRRHARLTVLATGTFLEDLGSKNGTSFGGVTLTGRATLKNGDEFACGQLVLTYRQSGAESPTATAVSRLGDPSVGR